MKVRNQLLFLSAIGMGLVGCSVENPWSDSAGEGGITLKLETSADVKDAIPVLRSGAPALEVPSAADFAISLENLSTGEVKKWNSLAEFNAQTSFATGSYKLTADYGTSEDEGFDKPYFSGSTNVTVLESRHSEVEVLATLANSMVSVDYTDNFKGYFLSYSSTVHSEGHSYVTFSQDETRPAFVVPGEITLSIEVTNPSGKNVTLQPASFPAMAQHHYHITFDVNQGETGNNQLQIIFDDSVEREDVSIDLTDELFSSPAPSIEPLGFVNGQLIETLEGNASGNKYQFNVVARGGLASAILTLSSDTFSAPFGNEIDLVSATPAQQDQLKDLGIDVKGLFKNPDKMAFVNLTEFAGKLSNGTVDVSLLVKDAYTRASEPVTVSFTTVPVELNANNGSAIMGDTNATIEVDYNGSEPEKNISFKALSKAGVYKDCEILNVQESTRTRSFETKKYIFTVKLPDTEHETIPVRVYFNGQQKMQVNVEVITPQFSADADVFSSYARLRITPENNDEKAIIVSALKIYLNGSAVDESKLQRNAESGIVTISGMNPGQPYSLGYGLIGSSPSKSLSVNSESATPLNNGDFSDVHQTINHSNVEVGGKYSYTIAYQATANIVRDEPTGWASINAKTCWFDCPGAKNTWFQVPSTYAENGKVVLRNVAYDHNGVKPAGMPTGLGKTSWYNTNVPTFTNFAAGELFLGTYAFSGSESRTDGITFKDRPSSVSFEYSYTPQGSDKGYVEVSVLDGSGSVIASNSSTLDASSTTTTKNVSLTNYPFGKKASSIRICFKSSNGSAPVHIPSGSELSEGFNAGNFGNKNLGNNNYHAVATGSVLTIDNVKLNY